MVEQSKVIFLAYAKDDRAFVSDLYKELKNNGLSPWLDEMDLLPGANKELIIKRIIKVSRFFLACMSKNSLSEKGEVLKYFRTALTEQEKMPPSQVYFIPVLIEEMELPDMTVGSSNLEDLHPARIYEEEARSRFISQLIKLINPNENKNGQNIDIQENISHPANTGTIKKLLEKGDLEQAIKLVLELTERQYSNYRNDAILLSGRFHAQKREQGLGLVSPNENRIVVQRVTHSLLGLIQQIEKENT